MAFLTRLPPWQRPLVFQEISQTGNRGLQLGVILLTEGQQTVTNWSADVPFPGITGPWSKLEPAGLKAPGSQGWTQAGIWNQSGCGIGRKFGHGFPWGTLELGTFTQPGF